MQPYFFPYIGYFQLINAVDKFVFYDDVNYIKNGWINRNRILIHNQPSYITVHLRNVSPFKLINQIEFIDNRPKLIKTIQFSYKKAPYYEDVWPIIEKCLKLETEKISDLAVESIKSVCDYLDLERTFELSSIYYYDTKDLGKNKRLKAICHRNKVDTYINAIGGQTLYSKKDFMDSNIDLYFLKPHITEYQQYNNSFTSNLSIIDIMMFNSIDDINSMLDNYELV